MAGGRVALVTGAGRPGGIGRAIAERLLRDGCTVVVTDVGGRLDDRPSYQAASEDDIAATVRDLSSAGDVVALECDVRDEAEVEAVVDEVHGRFGRLDVLVNNAGVAIGLKPLVDLDLDDWRINLDVMATGVFLCSRAAVRRMVRDGNGGRVISIASQAGKTGFPLLSAYCAAKFAVIGLTQSLAQEVGEHGITVNAVCPGTVATPMLELDGGMFEVYARQAGISREDYKRKIQRQIPLKRFATPDDVANAVGFLASPEAAYITGAALNVTGGQEMH